jgi:hypothetical protein
MIGKQMYKHVAVLTVRVTIETEESMSAEELEEIIHTLDYEFSSEYAKISTVVEDAHTISSNRAVK